MSKDVQVLGQEVFANYPQQPHGGKLVNRVVTGKKIGRGKVSCKTITYDYD